MIEAIIINAGANGVCSQSVTASSTIAAAAPMAISRIGRMRDNQASDQRPAAILPNAPITWVIVTRMPAAAGDQCRATISQVGTNVHNICCGITSKTLTAWTRARNELSRYGFRRCAGAVVPVVDGAGGSITPNTTAARPIAVTTAGTASAAATEWLAAMTGMVSAQTPMPSGCAVCRIPIAVPRNSGGNHPTTMRPLAPLAAPEPTPAMNRQAAIATYDAWAAAVIAAADVPTRVMETEISRIVRSPYRSRSVPQPTIAIMRPIVGIVASTEAWASDMPCWVCSAGMRYATPPTTTAVVIAATNEHASMVQRLVLLMVDVVVIADLLRVCPGSEDQVASPHISSRSQIMR